MRPTRGFVVGMLVYVVLTVGGALAIGAAEPPQWVRMLVAVPPCLAAIWAVGSQVQAARAREGVERAALLESASLAFFVTALASLSYGFFEAWAAAPKLNAFVVWSFAMGTWAVSSALYARRFR